MGEPGPQCGISRDFYSLRLEWRGSLCKLQEKAPNRRTTICDSIRLPFQVMVGGFASLRDNKGLQNA